MHKMWMNAFAWNVWPTDNDSFAAVNVHALARALTTKSCFCRKVEFQPCSLLLKKCIKTIEFHCDCWAVNVRCTRRLCVHENAWIDKDKVIRTQTHTRAQRHNRMTSHLIVFKCCFPFARFFIVASHSRNIKNWQTTDDNRNNGKIHFCSTAVFARSLTL